jgi:serine/threonine-protein kinase PpkA
MNLRVLALLWLLPFAALAQAPSAPVQGRTPMLLPGKQSLYQRIVTRPGATLTPEPNATNGRSVPGFSVFYVYTKQGNALEVGPTADGQTIGWIAADRAIDWQHTMVAAFTNPAGRQPVLFLDSERNERQLMLDGQAGEKADAMRAAAEAASRNHTDAAPVMAVEPETHVDFAHNFYLMPIIEAQTVEREFGPPLRLLQVISVPSQPPPAAPQQAPPYRAGVVFVMDTTLSMQPYIDRTRDAIRSIVNRIGASSAKADFRFGLVAYRDSLADNPGLGYPTKVYARPDFAAPADAINAALTDVSQATVSSTGFDEDPMGGIKAAMDEIDWSGLSGRYLVLVTDAGARSSTHPHSLTGMNIAEIRELAKARGIAILAIHLLTAEGRAHHDHESARAEYTELTQFDGAGSLYFPVQNGSADGFAQTVEALSSALLRQAAVASGHAVPGGGTLAPAQEQQIDVVSNAMRLTYLGRVEGTRAPDVLRSWTTDRDLAKPELSSLDVRVLLTRNQLSDLANSLQTIMAAGVAQRLDSQTFFTQLRSAFAATARDPNRIAHAQNIGGLLGEYLDGLPYQSDIMNIREADWLSMGAIAQRTVLNNVEAKLRLYQEFQASDLWVDLSGTRSAGEAMYPVPLEALP